MGYTTYSGSFHEEVEELILSSLHNGKPSLEVEEELLNYGSSWAALYSLAINTRCSSKLEVPLLRCAVGPYADLFRQELAVYYLYSCFQRGELLDSESAMELLKNPDISPTYLYALGKWNLGEIVTKWPQDALSDSFLKVYHLVTRNTKSIIPN